MARRGVLLTYETVRVWCDKFGPVLQRQVSIAAPFCLRFVDLRRIQCEVQILDAELYEFTRALALLHPASHGTHFVPLLTRWKGLLGSLPRAIFRFALDDRPGPDLMLDADPWVDKRMVLHWCRLFCKSCPA